MKFPINKRVHITTIGGIKDFYIIKRGFRKWYVEARHHGNTNFTDCVIGAFKSKKLAMVYIGMWDGWFDNDE